MDGRIIFSKDAILRFQSTYDDKTAIPLTTIQKHYNKSDYEFIVSQLRYNVVIEEGTTFGSLILSLEPWAHVFSDLVGSDVNAYIAQIKKPSVAENAFDWICIQQLIKVNRELDFGQPEEGQDILDWFNSPKEPKLLNTFDIIHDFDICGYCKGDTSNYSITGNISDMKNVPVIFSDNAYLAYFKTSRFKDASLINENALGVTRYNNMFFAKSSESFINLFEIIDVVFNKGLFYYSPTDADINNAIIMDRLNEVKEMIEDEKNDTQESKEQSEDNKETKRVYVDDESLSSVGIHINREKEEWNRILKEQPSESKFTVRIGGIVTATNPESRVLGFIDDKNSLNQKGLDDTEMSED